MSLHDQYKAVVAFAKAQLRRSGAYRSVYNSPEGAFVIHDILREAGVLACAHVPGEAGGTDFNAGKQAVGLYILDRLRFNEQRLVDLARQQSPADTFDEG